MRILIVALTCVSTLLGSAAAGHGQTPVTEANVSAFAGTWVLDVARSGLPENDAERRVITTGPTSMRVDIHRAKDAHPISLIYKFDGTRNTSPFGAGTAESQLVREESGLVLRTVFTINNHPITVQELLPSAIDGKELPIVIMLRVEHGYQGVAAPGERKAPNASNAVKYFVKQP